MKELEVVAGLKIGGWGSPETGKCVGEDTKIFTRDGLVEITEIRPGDIVASPSRWSVVKQVERLSSRTTLALELKRPGSKAKVDFTGTSEHKVLTGGCWVRLDELLPYWYGKNPRKRYGSRSKAGVVGPMEIDRYAPTFERDDVSRLLGLLLGDGTFSLTTVLFTNTDPALVQDVASIVKREFGAHLSRSKHDPISYRIVGKRGAVLKWIRSLGLDCHTAGDKFIPEGFHNLETVKGLYLADGWLGDDAVQLQLKSHTLINQVADILDRYGVHYNKYPIYEYLRLDTAGKYNVDRFMSVVFGKDPDQLSLNRRYNIGRQDVYDIELEGAHSFITESGIVAHNTFFIGTMPEPVYVIDTEFGSRQVFKYWFPDRDINVMEVRVVAKDPTKTDAEATFSNIEQAVYTLMDLEEGTIAIDSMSDIYGWMNEWVEQTVPKQTSKKSGEKYMMRTEWGKRNARYRNLVFQLISRPVNVFFSAQPKEGYAGGEGTGEFMARWLTQHDHWVDVVLHFDKWLLPGKPPRYPTTVDKCRMHRAPGMRIDDCTYPKLLKRLDDKFGLRIKGADYVNLAKQIKRDELAIAAKLKKK